MGLRRNDAGLVALITAVTYAVSFGIIGTNDLEEQFNGAYSYAASFGNGIFSSAPVFGRHTFLGVPVYDTSVGLGYRLPFLYGTSHSPLVFLRYVFSTEAIQLFCLWGSLFGALLSFNLMFKSWLQPTSRYFGLVALVLLDIAVLGPSTIYLFVNEWSTQAVQYFGAICVVSGLFDKSWFKNEKFTPLEMPRIPFAIATGIVFIFTGHSGNLVNYAILFGVPVVFHLFSKKIFWINKVVVFVLIGLFVSSATPNLIDLVMESSRQPFPRITAINWYQFELSLSGVKHVLEQTIDGNYWPLQYLTDRNKVSIDDNKGFFGLLSILASIAVIVFISNENSAKKALKILSACFILIIIQSLSLNKVGALRSSAAWQFRDPLLIISTVMIALVLATSLEIKKSVASKLTIIRSFALITLGVSSLFPISVMLIHVNGSGLTNGIISKQLNQRDSTWMNKLRDAGVKDGDRIYVANPDLFRFANWSGYEKLPQFENLNVSTINGWPKIRAAFTLAKNQAGGEAKFYNLIDSRFGCRTEELDFLAVDWVLDSNGECQGDYQKQYASNRLEIFNLGENRLKDGSKSVFLYRLNQQSIYTTDRNVETDKGDPLYCALLVEDNCLTNLQIDSELVSDEYFRLCLKSCIAEFQWISINRAAKIVLPLDYQPFFESVNLRTGMKLKIGSLNGLLTIDPGNDNKYGDSVRISLKPDKVMHVSAMATWASSIAWLFFCFRFLKKMPESINGKASQSDV